MPNDLQAQTRAATIRLTTRGRKTGTPRTVTVWFVVADHHRIYVQHVRGRAQWYRNLVATPAVQVDFGAGPVPGRATPIAEAHEVRRILGLFRQKYLLARVVQWLGRKQPPVAAVIELGDD